MRALLQVLSSVALAGIVIPPVLFFSGSLPHDGMKTIMLVATVLWFAATPFWMGRSTS